MATEGGSGGGGGDETAAVALNSPIYKVKFLCSYGGKILPRGLDGHLKYVGGETRVVAIPRDIDFSELTKKLSKICDGDMVLKYQLIAEDLDSLVSVRNDEDLKHMLEEYDRQESEGTPKLRGFLFPSNPVVIENQPAPVDLQAVEQRYIDAINGIVRSPSSGKLTPIRANRSSFSVSSACSSPKSNTSPESTLLESIPHEFMLMDGYQKRLSSMHKVQSSPSLCSLNNSSHHQTSNHHFLQQHHPHHFLQQHNPHSYSRSGPLPMGHADFVRSPIAHAANPAYTRSHSTSRTHLGGQNKHSCYDEPLYVGLRRFDRAENYPQSHPPSPRSPRKHFITESKGPG